MMPELLDQNWIRQRLVLPLHEETKVGVPASAVEITWLRSAPRLIFGREPFREFRGELLSAANGTNHEDAIYREERDPANCDDMFCRHAA